MNVIFILESLQILILALVLPHDLPRKEMGNKHSSSTSRRSKAANYPIPPNAARPGPPGQPQIEVEDETSVYVQFDPPVHNGGCPIIGYLVQHSELHERLWHTPNPPSGETHCWIINLTPGATYVFRAIAENILGYSTPSELSEPTVLRIECNPPKFLHELESVNALQHERVEFKARLAPGPTCHMTWFLDNAEVFPDDDHVGVEIRGHTLVIGKVENDCEVKCLVENQFGAAESIATLGVGVPPRIKEASHTEHFFRVGEIIRIRFNYSGKPVPTVHWLHDGKPVAQSQFQVYPDMTILKISDASRTHRGEYTVRIENSHGQDSSFALVTVADKPNPPSKPSVALMKDNSCLIEWKDDEDDGGCPVTTHTVEYFRAGWDVWLAGTTTRGKTSKIRDLIPGSQYIFRVKAENPYGQSEPSESSVQLFIPDLSSGLMSTVDEIEEEDTVSSKSQTPAPETRKSPEKTEKPKLTVPAPASLSNSSSSLRSNSPRRPHVKYTEPDAYNLRGSDFSPRQRSRTPTRPSSGAGPEPGYKPQTGIFDLYSTVTGTGGTRSSTLPRNSPKTLSASSLLSAKSELDAKAAASAQAQAHQDGNLNSRMCANLSSYSGRSQSSLDSDLLRSPSAASSSSHLIFEEESDEETAAGENSPPPAVPVVTSSLSFYQTDKQTAVRIKTSSKEELPLNSRDVSPIPPPLRTPTRTPEQQPIKEKKEELKLPEQPITGFRRGSWNPFKSKPAKASATTNAQEKLPRKNSAPTLAPAPAQSPEKKENEPQMNVQVTWKDKLLDWSVLPLLLAVFIKYVNFGVSVILIMYVIFRLCNIRA